MVQPDDKKQEIKPKQEFFLRDINLIPTTDIIKNIKVVYEEVKADIKEEEDFIIKPITKMSNKVKEVEEEEQQITLTFDLPLSVNKVSDVDDMISYETTEEVKKMPVNDYVELITVTESNEAGDIRYALEDYMEVESSMNKKQVSIKDIAEEEDYNVVFEKKIIEKEVVEDTCGEIDPMNSPISDMLKERAQERRQKMKDFNYKFNTSKIDDIEKVPAYKRQGVNLEDAKHSSETDMSRTSIGVDDNDDIQLRTNNSYLHDNVD